MSSLVSVPAPNASQSERHVVPERNSAGDGSQLRPRPQGVLISRMVDAFFIANLYWPLLFVVCWWNGEELRTGVLFWQVYFVTAPHRWITLILVATDRRRTKGSEMLFLGIAGAVLGSVCILNFSTGSLLCLGAIDYVWNAWHFAAQHHGIHRLYRRTESAFAPPSRFGDLVEKTLFRAFLLYVIARVAGVGWRTGPPDWSWHLKSADLLIAMIPGLLLVMAILRNPGRKILVPQRIYFLSVMTMFLAMLWAAHFERKHIVLQLALASAVFHSVEYMAVVTWASTSASQKSRSDLVGRMARQWALFLAFFVLFLGTTNYMLASGNQHLWIMINLIVAFLHYAYDGLIWKSGRPTKAASA